MKSKLRIALTIFLLVIIFAGFGWYIATHQDLLKQLKHISWLAIVLIVVLYFAFFGTLMMILNATLALCGLRLKPFENFSLNAYSKLANFFIPGQSGPILRGAYLKKRHQLKVGKYILATLMYFVCYAIVSAFMLLALSVAWWLTTLGVLVVGLVCLLVFKAYEKRKKVNNTSLFLNPKTLVFLFLATLAQAVIQFLIYYVELKSLHADVSISQVVTYTGAANFSLFVALTPGAIGIRESFLIFSEHLHQISSGTIVAVGIVDRSIFLLYLGLLFLALIIFHGGKKLRLTFGRLKDTPKP